jgi:hypothetical protein
MEWMVPVSELRLGSGKIGSHRAKIAGHEWYIFTYAQQHPKVVDSPNPKSKGKLPVYLVCASANEVLTFDWEIMLVNLQPSESVLRKGKFCFSREVSNRGSSGLVAYTTLMDPSKGFIIDGKITIRAFVTQSSPEKPSVPAPSVPALSVPVPLVPTTSSKEIMRKYKSQGKHEEALAVMLDMLATKEAALGPEHLEVATVRTGIADLYKKLRRPQEALAMYKQVAATYEMEYGVRHELVAVQFGIIGVLQQHLGDYDAAVSSFDRCAAIYSELYGATHDETVHALGRKATAIRMAATFSMAEAMVYAQASKLRPIVTLVRGLPGSAGCSCDHRLHFNWFGTMAARRAKAKSGKHFYEVQVVDLQGTPAVQFGWADGEFDVSIIMDSDEGVGDDAHSWSVDGARAFVWYNGQDGYWGKPWVNGDVVGVAADLDARTISFGLNGVWEGEMGVAFTDIDVRGGLYPALTAARGEYQLNLGDDLRVAPFLFGPPNPSFMPIALSPPPADTRPSSGTASASGVINAATKGFWTNGVSTSCSSASSPL